MRFCTLLKERFYLFIFREGKGGRKRGREISLCGCLLHAPLLGTWPATQACALDWESNWTSSPLVCGPNSIHWATPARARLCISNQFQGDSVAAGQWDTLWEIAKDMAHLKRVPCRVQKVSLTQMFLTLPWFCQYTPMSNEDTRIDTQQHYFCHNRNC